MKPVIWTIPLALWLTAQVSFAAAPAPLLYVPFDGSADAVSVAAAGRPNLTTLTFQPGKRGQAILLNADCGYATAGNFATAQGTIALWVCPEWPGSANELHYLFCVYGDRALPQSYAMNRFSVYCSGGDVTFMVYPQAGGKPVSIKASIRQWQPHEWHHVAVTWSGINSGKDDARLNLYLDGKPAAASAPGLRLDVGKTSDTMYIGRDADASPDYALALLDDFYIYGQALGSSAIAAGVAAAAAPQTAEPTVTPAMRQVAGWSDAGRRFRAAFHWTAGKAPISAGTIAEAPFDLQNDLAALGLRERVDDASLKVVALQDGRETQALPWDVADGRLRVQLPDGPAAGDGFVAYFGTLTYDFSVPLAARQLRTAAPVSHPPLQLHDYATDAYHAPWDFDNGDFAGIDQWGNKPEFITNRKVENGILSFDVQEDPWFVWGDMWGQVKRRQHPVAIDLNRYPVLEMKIRQSIGSAKWQLFGRVGQSDNLLTYDFHVTGTGWQIIRVNLLRDAHWHGVLSAFRIDPTDGVTAHIDIDWIRLESIVDAQRDGVEVLPSGGVSQLRLTIPQTMPTAGANQEIVVTALDRRNQPVSGQPLTVAVNGGPGASVRPSDKQSALSLGATACRGLTDRDGRLILTYAASRQAAPKCDRITAKADFAAATPVSTAIDTVAGPPDHYAVTPLRPVVVPDNRLPVHLEAQLVDQYGNPLTAAGTITWSGEDGATLRNATTKLVRGKATAELVGDLAQRWVYRVHVRDAQGREGVSASISMIPTAPKPDPVHIGPTGYFVQANGKPFIPLGGFYANWVGVKQDDGTWRNVSFSDVTEDQLRTWLGYLQSCGVTAMRFMLRTHRKNGMEPMDVGGRVNPELFASVLRYLDIARHYGIRFHLVVHEDYTKPIYYNGDTLTKFALPTYTPDELQHLTPPQKRFLIDRNLLEDIQQKYTDPDAIACQDMYARELAGYLKNNPQVLSYELENEMVNCPASWANHAIATLKSVDPATPVCVSHGGGGLFTADPLWWFRNTKIDFYTYHLYPQGGTTTPALDYGTAVDLLTRYGRMCGPAFLGESSGDQWGEYPKDRDHDRAWIMRDIIWMSLLSGNPGCFFWNARAGEIEEFRLARKITDGIDWTKFQRAKAAIGIDVSHPLTDDKFFRTEAGRTFYANMGKYAWYYLSRGEDFDFTTTPGDYAVSAKASQFTPRDDPHPAFGVAPGYQLKYLASADDKQALLYVRNVAGIRLWESPNHWKQWIRERKPAPMRVTVNRPAAWTATVYDLDAGAMTEASGTAGGSISADSTDHDFVVVLRAR